MNSISRCAHLGLPLLLAIAACSSDSRTDIGNRNTTDSVRKSISVVPPPAAASISDLQQQVERRYTLRPLPLVLDSLFLDATVDSNSYSDTAMTSELIDLLGLGRAWDDASPTKGTKPEFVARDLSFRYVRHYPVCRFRAPSGDREFLLTHARGGAGGFNTFILLTHFPVMSSDSVHAYVIAEYHADGGGARRTFSRIDYPTITTQSLTEEFGDDTETVVRSIPGSKKIWRIDLLFPLPPKGTGRG